VNSRWSLCVYTSTLLHNALKNKGKPTCIASSKDDYPVNIGKLKIRKVPRLVHHVNTRSHSMTPEKDRVCPKVNVNTSEERRYEGKQRKFQIAYRI